MARAGRAARLCQLVVLSSVAAPVAAARPWVRAPGGGYARLAVSAEEAGGLAARRVDAYAEYGLTAHWTLTAKAEGVVFDRDKGASREGYRLTMRRGLLREGPIRLAVEGGIVGGEAISGFGGCAEAGVEVRASVGGTWTVRGAPHFAFADIARRQHGEGCSRDRLEFGMGQALGEKWTLTSQFWLERGTGDARSDKSEIALTRSQSWGQVSLAYRYEFSGLFDETAMVLAFSRDF